MQLCVLWCCKLDLLHIIFAGKWGLMIFPLLYYHSFRWVRNNSVTVIYHIEQIAIANRSTNAVMVYACSCMRKSFLQKVHIFTFMGMLLTVLL